MKGFQIWLWGILVASVCLFLGLLYQSKQEELDVATGVAEAFLQSVVNGDSNSLFALASQSYQQRLPKAPSENKKLEIIPENVQSWTLEKHLLSANKAQAVWVG